MNTSSSSHAHGLVQLADVALVAESRGPETARLLCEEFQHRLRQLLRPSDKLVHVAKDKCFVVLDNIRRRAHLDLAAAKLARVFEEPADIVGDSIPMAVHAGLVMPAGQNVGGSALMRAAEIALQHASRTGVTCSVFEYDAVFASQPDLTLLPRVGKAIEAGEFTLFYQPKVDAGFAHVVGAEGLVRWIQGPEQNILSPFHFIEAVEESDLIKPLTEQLLKLGVAQCAKWPGSQGVAINLSPSIFERYDFVDVAADILDIYDVAPKRLILEVTERGDLTSYALDQLHALRELDIQISIDDFGTGSCSLSYFRDLPADQIKIDQTFVQGMLSSRKDHAIVKSCIELAHGCGMKVVAEGVEDEQTVDALRALQCDQLQGYWFGKPLPASAYQKQHLDGLVAQAQEPDLTQGLEEGNAK